MRIHPPPLPMLLLGLILTFATTQAQKKNKIIGTIKDSATQKALPYASVSLLLKDTFFVGTAAKADGKFELFAPAGEYIIEATATGFVTARKKLTLIKSPDANVDILMQPESGALKEVTITQLKSLVEDKGDRLVYNADKDISNAGGTAADVLRKVPMLSVDINGNVQMRGSSNLRILINGKPSAMMARNLADALRQMPANTIKSVEVITSPGARYDAEGSAGIINIITKKGLQGFNGNINATAGNLNRGVGGSLSYRKHKLGVSLSLNTYQYRNKSEGKSLRTALNNGETLTTTEQASWSDNTGTGANGELSIDYDIDSLTRINFAANIWGGNFPSNSDFTTKVTDPQNNILASYLSSSRFRNPFGNGQLDLGYTKTLNDKGREFSILTQFSRMPDNYFYETDLSDDRGNIFRTNYSDNYSRNKEYTGQTDYIHPFTVKGRKDTLDFKVEIGAKAIYRDIGSEYLFSYRDNITGPEIEDPSQSNVFEYTQKVFSGYFSMRMESRKKWSVVAGMRLERTELDGNFRSTQTLVNSNFNNLIPSVNISKGIKKHRVKLSYTQRIHRPMIWLLNPWRNANDPKNIWTGNPYLLPELNHLWELGNSYSGENGLSINAALFVRHTNKGFEFLADVDSLGNSVTMPRNIGKRLDIGLNLNTSFQPTKEWNVSGGVDVNHVDLKTTDNTLQNSGWVWRFNFNSSYKFPKDYSVQANGNYGSGWIGLQNKNSGWYWYSISAKKELWDKKASLTLGLNNPFQRAINFRNRRFDPSFIEASSFQAFNRSFRLTFEWRFGQMTTSAKQSKKISNDDKGGR